MGEKVSSYVEKIKDWKMRDIIENYINAMGAYRVVRNEFQNGNMISFKSLRKMSDYLWNAKEGNYLIFRRMTVPKERIFEDVPKVTPNDDEIDFMNNVGLLFHKVLVARELKYVLEHYEEDSETYQETKAELKKMLKRIKRLFKNGIEILFRVLENQKGNIPLLTYLLENQEKINQILDIDLISVLKRLTGKQAVEQAYFQVGKFYIDSGWPLQAKPMFEKVLTLNPNHTDAQQSLKECAPAN